MCTLLSPLCIDYVNKQVYHCFQEVEDDSLRCWCHCHTVRNHRFKDPVSSHWEDISTLPELFEISCKNHSDRFFLGTRRLIAREVETSETGKCLRNFIWVIVSGRPSGRRLKLCVVLLLVWFRLDTSLRNVLPFWRIREKSGSLRYRVASCATSLWLLSIHLWERKLFVTRSMRLALCFSSLFGHLS
ncbi:hypothetical protein Bca4012_020539 [Brassica carinata]